MIPFCSPRFDDIEQPLEDILRAMISGDLTNNGYHVRSLEEEIQDHCSVKHAIAVCNATVGLEVVAKALDLKGEIIVPSYTFAATVQAMRWVGLEPVFCDVRDMTDHNISVDMARELITPKTAAILGVHLWGEPCDTLGLESLGVPVFYDAAHAFGCDHLDRRPVGNFGRAEVFSFHATKYVHGAEGGAITTNDDDLAKKIRRMICFGGDNGTVVSEGTNAKMSEPHAILVRESLSSESENRRRNKLNHDLYSLFPFTNGVRVHPISSVGRRNYQYVTMVAATPEHRSRVLQALAPHVEVRRYFPALHRQIPGEVRRQMTWTEHLADRTFCVPNGHLTKDEVTWICEIMERVRC